MLSNRDQVVLIACWSIVRVPAISFQECCALWIWPVPKTTSNPESFSDSEGIWPRGGRAGIEGWKGFGGGGGSRTRVRKCYWSRDYMLIRVPAPGITLGRSRPPLRTDKKRVPLAWSL